MVVARALLNPWLCCGPPVRWFGSKPATLVKVGVSGTGIERGVSQYG